MIEPGQRQQLYKATKYYPSILPCKSVVLFPNAPTLSSLKSNPQNQTKETSLSLSLSLSPHLLKK